MEDPAKYSMRGILTTKMYIDPGHRQRPRRPLCGPVWQTGMDAAISQLLEWAAANLPAPHTLTERTARSAPLHAAVWCDHVDVLRAMISAGAPVNEDCYFLESRTPLHLAVELGRLGCVRVLLEEGHANPHAMVACFYLATPLHLAAQVEIAEELLRHGADVFAKDFSGSTPLQDAIAGRDLGYAAAERLVAVLKDAEQRVRDRAAQRNRSRRSRRSQRVG